MVPRTNQPIPFNPTNPWNTNTIGVNTGIQGVAQCITDDIWKRLHDHVE